MELNNTQVYSTTTDPAFAVGRIIFPVAPAATNDPRYAQVALTEEETLLASSATPDEGVDFALMGGEFGGGDLASDGLGHNGRVSYFDDAGHLAEIVEEEGVEDVALEAGPSCPVLFEEDWATLQSLKDEARVIPIEDALHWYDAESVVRLVQAGFAVGEMVEGERMLSLTDAWTTETKAAAARDMETIAMVSARAKVLAVRKAAAAIESRLDRLGANPASVLRSALVAAHPSDAVDAAITGLGRASYIRRVRAASLGIFVGLPGADFKEAAKRELSFQEAAEASAKFKRLATELRVPSPEQELELERRSGPEPDSRFASSALEAERSGEAVIHTASGRDLAPSRNPKQRAAAIRRLNRSLNKGSVTAEEGAWNTALATHLVGMEDPALRLELQLRAKGARAFNELLKGTNNPDELRAAARKLTDDGKIVVARDEKRGHVLTAVAGPLADEERATLLTVLMTVMVESRISVPKGTGLERRLGAFRARTS